MNLGRTWELYTVFSITAFNKILHKNNQVSTNVLKDFYILVNTSMC